VVIRRLVARRFLVYRATVSVQDQVLRTVGRYEIVREVGRGGTAVVYLARQTDLDRDVALKELAAFRAANGHFVERFIRESRLAGSLSHPNIVTVHDYFEHGGTAFIAMEYFARGSLRPLVGRLRLEQVGGVLDGLLAGLAHAERRGVVHRDLKPENVMVTTEGGVKIADFGIAKSVHGPALRSLTGAGAAVGTPAYMAPELVTGGEVGPWTDLYALGVTAYELLAGRLPFDETDVGLALMLMHAKEPAPPLRSVRPDLDPGLAAWVDTLLAKDPRDRPTGAAVAAENLDEILISTLGPRWRRQARLETIEEAVDPDGDGRTPTTRALATPALPGTARPRSRRRFWMATATAVAAGVLALVIAIVAATRSDDRAPPAKPKPAETVADLVPRPQERLTLAVAGPTVAIADPSGRVARLEPDTFRVGASQPDPARPRSATFARGALLVADDESLTALDPVSLAPRAATRAAGASLLAKSGGVVALSLGGAKGARRVCVVGSGPSLGPCVALPFAPAGLGVAPSGRVFVANAGSGAVATYLSTRDSLVAAGAPIPVGRRPHGRLLVHGGLLYVPVERGVAIVDPDSRRVTRTVKLPVTPSDVWIVPRTHRLFAALPGVDRVALLDTRSPARAPRLVAAGREPVAVAGGTTSGVPVVVMSADGTATRLDARTGARLGAKRITVLGAPPPARLVLRRVAGTSAGDRLAIVLRFTGGRLDEGSLVVRDGTLVDGKAAFEVWQGGIRTRLRTRIAHGITIRVTSAASHLRVTVAAPRGAYERLRISREGPRAIALSMRRPSRVESTPRTGETSGGTSTRTPPSGDGTTSGGTPRKKPKPPPTGQYEVG
jgi:Protein kinase domain